MDFLNICRRASYFEGSSSVALRNFQFLKLSKETQAVHDSHCGDGLCFLKEQLRDIYFVTLFQFILQWNLDLTKSLGTGQICSLNRGFVISKTSI